MLLSKCRVHVGNGIRLAAAAVIMSSTVLGGCAATQKPVRTEAALGRVIIYRNGVAYFERRARIKGDELTITVPAERVDDFLKSLTVTDAATGKSLPVSYPTVLQNGDEVEMTIKLPRPVPKELKVSYVTASPAWKPSYRLVLKDGGKARLEAWAVVDNVSGEDWKSVTVGVGSTSALSFKYDLKSVRMVERETLGDNNAVALAPPTGGSPYQVKSGEVQILGNFRVSAVDSLREQQEHGRYKANNVYDAERKASGRKGYRAKKPKSKTRAYYGASGRGAGRAEAEPQSPWLRRSIRSTPGRLGQARSEEQAEGAGRRLRAARRIRQAARLPGPSQRGQGRARGQRHSRVQASKPWRRAR